MNDESIAANLHQPIHRKLTLDEENLARDMWQLENKSASQIVEALGYVLTRNAIIGMAHRRGWTKKAPGRRVGEVKHPRPAPQINRGSSQATSHGVRKFEGRVRLPGVKFAPTPPRKVEQPRKRSVPIWDLKPHHCKWVMGEPKEFKYCGTRRAGDGPYCERHHALSYVPRNAEPRKRAEGFRLPPVPGPNVF